MIKRLKHVEATVQSTCIRCSGRRFESKLLDVQGLRYRPTIVQCSKCGRVVSTVDRQDNGALLKHVQTQLNQMALLVGQLKKK